MSLFPKLQTKAINGFDRTLNIFAFISATLIILMMLTICFDVVTRRIGFPQEWTIEITEDYMIFITFLGTAWLLKREGHVRMDILVTTLSPRIQTLLGIVTSIIGVVISLYLVIWGSITAWDHYQRGVFQMTPLLMPTAPLLAIIPIGSIPLLIQFLRRTYGYIGTWRLEPNREGNK